MTEPIAVCMLCAVPYVSSVCVCAVGFYQYQSISFYSTSVEQMCNNVLLFIAYQPMKATGCIAGGDSGGVGGNDNGGGGVDVGGANGNGVMCCSVLGACICKIRITHVILSSI